MRAWPNLACSIAALALMALAPPTGAAAQGIEPGIVAQASDADADEGGDETPRRRGAAEEPEATDDPAPPRMSASSVPDLFDADDERPGAHPNQAKDTVVCLAGCEGARGAVVYKKPK